MASELVLDRQKAKVKEADDKLTPLEVAQALKSDQSLPFAIAPLLRSGQRPAQFTRQDWSEDAAYFSANKGAKRLIVGFTGRALRLGVPISYFLQMLPDDRYDVIVLYDRDDLHYMHGIHGLGDFAGSMARIRNFAEAQRYEEVIAFGSSGGGLPALRAGGLLGAHRSISVSGRYLWHPGRLIRGQVPVPAFDSLCACHSGSATELVSIYGSGNEIDAQQNAQLKKTLPECLIVPIRTEKHMPLYHFYQAHLLPIFMACLFEYWDEVDLRNDLIARLEQAVRLDQLEKNDSQNKLKKLIEARRSAQRKHSAQKSRLEAIYGSYSWRMTSPLRALKRLLSRKA